MNRYPRSKTLTKGKILVVQKYLQIIHLIRVYYPEYIKNSYKTTKKDNSILKMSKLLKFSEDIQIADKYKIRFSIHHYGIVRCKLKPQGGTTLQPLGWL